MVIGAVAVVNALLLTLNKGHHCATSIMESSASLLMAAKIIGS